MPITVIVPTQKIELNSKYEILTPGEEFQIEATVIPNEATQKITYKSLDEKIVYVSETGLVKGLKNGSTSIVVSNEELQETIIVIVQEGLINTSNDILVLDGVDDVVYLDNLNVKEYPIITKEMLQFYYNKGKKVLINNDDYIIILEGVDIVNFENELETDLNIKRVEEGFTFEVNKGNDICGKIVVDFSKIITDEKYLYLYNNAKNEYEQLETENIEIITIDTAGTYFVTSNKIEEDCVPDSVFKYMVVPILLIFIVFIVIKNKHWFW